MADKALSEKFCEAWGAIENPPLDSVNPHFKNRYASLKATLGSVRAVCAPRGMVYKQMLRRHEDGYRLHSSVESGSESMELSEFPVETPPNAQSFGSDLTYRKRQQAQADWGIVGEEDDDGEAAAKGSRQPGPLDAAKQRLWNAVKAYAAKNRRDPKDVMKDVQKRPQWASQQSDAGYLDSVAAEYEELANG